MKEYLKDMLARLSKDDPYEGTSVKGFLHLMQNHEMEILGIVTNYAAAERINQDAATDACYEVMLGHFLDKFDPQSVFIVADALGRDDEGFVRTSRDMQFIYAVLWSMFMHNVREASREMMREIRAEVLKDVTPTAS